MGNQRSPADTRYDIARIISEWDFFDCPLDALATYLNAHVGHEPTSRDSYLFMHGYP